MNPVTWTPMKELKGIRTHLNQLFDDVPLHLIDDDGFSLLDWVPPVEVEEIDKESSNRHEARPRRK